MPSKKEDNGIKVDTAEFYLTSEGILAEVAVPPGRYIAKINGIDWVDIKYLGRGYIPGLPRRLIILYKDGKILGEMEAEQILIHPDLKPYTSSYPGGGRIIYRGWW